MWFPWKRKKVYAPMPKLEHQIMQLLRRRGALCYLQMQEELQADAEEFRRALRFLVEIEYVEPRMSADQCDSTAFTLVPWGVSTNLRKRVRAARKVLGHRILDAPTDWLTD